jgi:hypothetical protein
MVDVSDRVVAFVRHRRMDRRQPAGADPHTLNIGYGTGNRSGLS